MFRKAVLVLGALEVLVGAGLLVVICKKHTQIVEPGTVTLDPVPWVVVSAPLALVVGGLIAYALASLAGRVRRAREARDAAAAAANSAEGGGTEQPPAE